MSGFALYIVVYLLNAKVMLIDPTVARISETVAIITSLGVLATGWLLYDLACRLLQNREKILMFVVVALVSLTSYTTFHLFSGRAAFILTGAMMATIMTANVFFWIIPGQRAVIKSMREGEAVDPIHGKRGKQRSVHNTYFTLPVLFAMLSNHFSLIYSHPTGWFLLIVLMVAAFLVRIYFVQRHFNRGDWKVMLAAVSLIVTVAIFLAPSSVVSNVRSMESISTDSIYPIIQTRCAGCHSATPTLMPITPKNLILTSRELIEQNSAKIYMQVVQQRAMPVGNLTQMTEDERTLVKSWFESR